jgi:hypothetical protein
VKAAAVKSTGSDVACRAGVLLRGGTGGGDTVEWMTDDGGVVCTTEEGGRDEVDGM